jgi:NAD(P)-dependent dehydrogenase (short-subunit alcohol dehydrogenase family)
MSSSKVAIVTGASQGVGRSTAIRLARDFASIVLVARNRENLDQTADAVKKAGAEALALDLDLSDPAAAQSVFDPTLSAFGQIDALLNIAGAAPQIDLFEMTDAQWDGGLALKLHGARRLTIATWPALKEAKGAVAVPQSALRGSRDDQRGDRSTRQGFFGSRHRRRRPGQ